MTLRRKLISLHVAFTVFAVGAAFATIYGVQLRVRGVVASFQGLVDQAHRVESLRLDAHRQVLQLREVVEGRREVNASYLARRDAFFTRLEETSNFAGHQRDAIDWESVRLLGRNLRSASDRCLALARSSRQEEAMSLMDGRIENDLLPALVTRLLSANSALDEARRRSGSEVLATNKQLLWVAVLIGASGAGLVTVGTIVVRRWFIAPVGDLHAATMEFADGNLDHRVRLESVDELGSLGSALNVMASSLKTSQTKYRSLFENLRDAVIICDDEGSVVECRDSDTSLLGVAPKAAIGHRVWDIWPRWCSATWDLRFLVGRVTTAGEQIRAVDVELIVDNGGPTIVDVIAYPVEYSGERFAAIVIRDVTERHRLQGLVRRSETMEATVTFARGIAHDFKNLLGSAVTTLSLIKATSGNSKDADRARTALRACQQAASLSKRLAEFAGTDQGNPQVFCLSEMVELILSSLDEPFLAPLAIETDCGGSVPVRMDRDQLTQVVLNLIYNAREAMPEGGKLNIATGVAMTSNPVERAAPAEYAVLTVRDTGCGMTTEVRERLFEPFFTTKSRRPSSERGMGMAVVYAAVNNAGGFVQVDSEVGVGTTFRVCLPSGQGMVSSVEPGACDPEASSNSNAAKRDSFGRAGSKEASLGRRT